MQTQLVNFAIPKKILSEADKMAAKESRSRSELFREAIRRYLSDKAKERKDFEQIKKAAEKMKMNENQAMSLVEKIRNQLPINK